MSTRNPGRLALLLVTAALVGCGSRTPLSAPTPATGVGGAGGAGGATATSSSSSGHGGGPATSSSSTGQSSAVTSSSSGPLGCSDGTREGFVNLNQYPAIAGCSGGWSVPGVLVTLAPTCGLVAGNSSANPNGKGCSVADLCAAGYHVCAGPGDVAAHAKTGCAGAAAGAGLFFATRQSSNGCGVCALGVNTDPIVCDGSSCAAGCAQTKLTANDLFGCGSLGAAASSCGGLDRFSGNLCEALGAPWLCDDPQNNGYDEANVVTKASSAGGGVLCCAN